VRRYSDEQVAQALDRVSCVDLAIEFGAVLRQSGRRSIGSCPLCGGSARATRFEAQQDRWVCAVCCRGGDAIGLVRAVTGCGFAEAIERLGGGAGALTGEEAAAAARRRADADARRAREAEARRRGEIERLRALWRGAAGQSDAPARAYLIGRGIDPPEPFGARCVADLPYYDGETAGADGRARPREVWRGPAMLWPMVGPAGDFVGLHLTWLDPSGPKGKARIVDPETGAPLPAKKMRGAARGAHLRLARCESPRRLILGEGIETTLAARTALARAGALRPGDAFWSAGSLQNLGGPHDGLVAHPEARSPAGRPLRVPGPEPDLSAPGLPIPDEVDEVVLLGDGDSDAFTTRCALQRGVARYRRRRDGTQRRARFVMADAGGDFNDMLGVA